MPEVAALRPTITHAKLHLLLNIKGRRESSDTSYTQQQVPNLTASSSACRLSKHRFSSVARVPVPFLYTTALLHRLVCVCTYLTVHYRFIYHYWSAHQSILVVVLRTTNNYHYYYCLHEQNYRQFVANGFQEIESWTSLGVDDRPETQGPSTTINSLHHRM